MRRFILAAALICAVPALAEDQRPQPESTSAVAARSSVTARDFMVATANPLATRAGYGILRAGGSAADAAVAVQMMLNLVEPQSSGLGGGTFLLYWDAALHRLTTYDGRETAPAAATPAYWLGKDGEPVAFWDAVPGGRSTGVPGTLKLMERLHDRHGRLPWSRLFRPAITRAARGFTISPRLADSIAEARDHQLDGFPAARAYFFHPDGTPRAAGETLRNPAFARTLRLIAAQGSAPFYRGAIAGDIIAATRDAPNPGLLTMADLRRYRAKIRPPVCLLYRGTDICGMGPPSSGALTVGQTLGILSRFDLAGLGPGPKSDHLFIEASKLAFADRAMYMADSDFVPMPTAGLLDPAYLASRAKLIDPAHAMGEATAGTPPWKMPRPRGADRPRPNHGTSHFVIKDRHGDMISATTTIETGFGSRVMVDGFLLNNELTDFSFAPMENGRPVANRVEGGKRPRSSMSPTIVLKDGKPMLLIGSPGGSSIIPYVAQSLIGILDFGLDPQTAIDAPHIVNRNGDTQVEQGDGADATIKALQALGQTAEAADTNSGLQAILVAPDGTLTGAADKRREGLALGD